MNESEQLAEQNERLAAEVTHLRQQIVNAGPPTRVGVAFNFVAMVRQTTPLIVVETDNGPRPFTKKTSTFEDLAADAAYDLIAQYFLGKVKE